MVGFFFADVFFKEPISLMAYIMMALHIIVSFVALS